CLFAETDQPAAFLGDVAHRQPGAVAIAPGDAVDRREQLVRAHAADVPQSILEYALLDRDLRGGLEVLQAATAADAEVGAGRRRARRTGGAQFRHARQLVVGLAAKHFDRNTLADQRPFDKHRLAVNPGDAA